MEFGLIRKVLCVLAACVCWTIIFTSFDTGLLQWNQRAPETTQYHYVFKGQTEKSQCQNVLQNLTAGKWVSLSNPQNNASFYDAIYHGYWMEREITDKLWRDDGKCGNDK